MNPALWHNGKWVKATGTADREAGVGGFAFEMELEADDGIGEGELAQLHRTVTARAGLEAA